MRLFLQFTVFTCLAVPAFASADVICRDSHFDVHGSVVKGMSASAYLITRDCPENPLLIQQRFPQPAIRWSSVDSARSENPLLQSTQITVPFDLNSSSLTRTASALLREVSAGSTVSIIGYACEVGEASHNLKLSQRRADAVASHLRARGVLVRSVEGKGECCPVSDQLELNRRVEIKAIHEGE